MFYENLLQDTRWRQKREEALQFHGHTCKQCGLSSSLQVHHPRYARGRMPWQYQPSELEVLCRPCHEQEHPRQLLKKKLIQRLNMLLLDLSALEKNNREILALQEAIKAFP